MTGVSGISQLSAGAATVFLQACPGHVWNNPLGMHTREVMQMQFVKAVMTFYGTKSCAEMKLCHNVCMTVIT